MLNLLNNIKNKVNHLIFSFIFTGIILIMLAILIVWTDFILKLVIGLFVLVVAYSFIYTGYKLWLIKKEVENHFKL